MLFNSIDFAIFLPIVFILYWFVTNKNLKLQNFLLTASSYVFYGWWDWRFLSLILISTLVDYGVGMALMKQDNQAKRKGLLLISLLVNLGFLGFFKYYNFFLDNFILAFSFFGTELNARTLNVILPVGISFYTFQTLSYSIDVYHRKVVPTKDFVAFSAFVSFFPQLVAGPIERAKVLLPQFYVKRKFIYSDAVIGLRQILLGLFKKILIADNCAIQVDQIFDNYHTAPPSALWLGILYFAIQIYGDFSGYSDIALGTARLFGFRLMTNFRTPYLSRNIAEFWRRWHISLSSWFRDYLYIPLGGSRKGKMVATRNILLVFLVSGFWHGANWTFVLWGFIHALAFLPLLIFGYNKKYTGKIDESRLFPSLHQLGSMTLTFLIVCIAWVFFRAPDVSAAFEYLGLMISPDALQVPSTNKGALPFVVLMFLIDWFVRDGSPTAYFEKYRWLRWSIYLSGIILLYFYGVFENKSFIYFQF